MFTKNLEQLLRLLQVSRQSGLLVVESAESSEAAWQGYIQLVEGNVTICQVQRKTGKQLLFSGDEARSWLVAQGKLNWNLEETAQIPEVLSPSYSQQRRDGEARQPESEPSRRVNSAPLPPVWVPRRTAKGMVTSAQSLGSLETLQVFTLVNGHNTIEGITRILRKSPDAVMRVLDTLRRAGLVE